MTDRVNHVQELRRGSTAQPHRNRSKYHRPTVKGDEMTNRFDSTVDYEREASRDPDLHDASDDYDGPTRREAEEDDKPSAGDDLSMKNYMNSIL